MKTVVVRVPGDKSITHRTLLFGALADGTSRIRGALDSADTRSTMNALRMLGITMPEALLDDVEVRGAGIRGWQAPASHIDCGNSGTTARLLMGAIAGYPFAATLDGDASLRSRPMRRVTTPLTQMGASFEELDAVDRLPITIRGGALRPIDFFSAQSSAQVKSALLLAGLVGDTQVAVTEPRLSRDHTERMLTAMGATLDRSTSDNGAHRVSLEGATSLQPLDMRVPGDFSSAAFFIACGLLIGNVRVVLPDVGLNPARSGMLDVLRRMNGNVSVTESRMEANEPIGEIEVASTGSLRGTTIEPHEIPGLIDEIPILAVLAACADGETRITGASELRVKETDRIRAVVENLRRIGADADELEDGLVVHGGKRPLRGMVSTYGDHRIAMSFGVLASLPGNDITIDDPSVVDVSYPGFWHQIAEARAAADAA